MKKTILLIFILANLLRVSSQDFRLTEKQWFAIEISDIDGGNSIEFPKDRINFPFTTLNFTLSGLTNSNNYLVREYCEKGFVAHVNYNDSNTSFDFIDFTPINVTDNCNSDDVEMQNFMSLYIDFFNEFSFDTFNYFIMDVYGVDNLIIENSNGKRVWFTENPTEFIPEELAQKWYLHKTIINNVETIAPNGLQYGFTNIELNISNYFYENIANHILDLNQTFNTTSCYLTNALIDLDTVNQEFYLYDLAGTLDACGNSVSQNFSNQYMNLFWNNLPGPFVYEINDLNNLVITNAIGNKAIYGQFALSVANNTFTDDFLIYPNPVKDVLNIDKDKVISVAFYNEIGQLIGSYNDSIIDVSSFNKGVYFVKFTLKSGLIKTQKVIKTD